MLTLHALTTGYRHTIISRHLNATLPQGTLTALLGTNGAGKAPCSAPWHAFSPHWQAASVGKAPTPLYLAHANWRAP